MQQIWKPQPFWTTAFSLLPLFTLSRSVTLSLLFLSPGFHANCCSSRLASTCLPGKDFACFLLQPEQKLKDTMAKWSSVAPSSSRRHHPGLGVLLVLTEDPELFAGLALSLSPLPLDLCASSVRAFQCGICLLLGISIHVLGHPLVLWEI